MRESDRIEHLPATSERYADAALLDAWQAGDCKAGDKLCSRHYLAVLRYFERRSPHDAFEFTQDTFERCCKTFGRIRQGDSFRAYVFRIAHCKFIDHLRASRRNRNRMVDLDTDSLLDAGVSPSKAAAASEAAQRLATALYALPFAYQNILELHYFSGLTLDEIAATLAVPPGTVRTRIRVGRKKLLALVNAADGFGVRPDERTIVQWLQEFRTGA